MSCTPRLNRLFGADGKCLNVAVDHGFFNEWAFLQGIENMSKVVETLATAQPDAIQLSIGMARHLQLPSFTNKPALVLRTDVANVYGKELPTKLFSQVIEDAAEQAIRLDAACVVVNLFRMPNQPEVHHECVKNICVLKPQCERYGMPLMVEPLVMQSNSQAGGYMVDGDIEKIVPLVRQATELGADIIKADPCDNLDEYHKVVEAAAGCPVLPRGGGKVSDDEVLRRTKKLMEQGACGIVYGRNIIQHEAPSNMVRALMAVIHDGSSVEAAQAHLH
jgi:DhnA family fructose-bisphosphate aldolase class Ia